MDNPNHAATQIRSIIERIERLEAEKAELTADIREVYSEAKANGFEVKALREIIKIRKTDKSERAELDAILDLYMSALGMW